MEDLPGFEMVPEGTMALLDKISDNLDVALANAAQYDAKSWARLSADHLEMILAILTAHRATQKGGESEATDYKALYHELLYRVSIKHPDETRHQTALRYIKNAENQNNAPQSPKETGNAQD